MCISTGCLCCMGTSLHHISRRISITLWLLLSIIPTTTLHSNLKAFVCVVQGSTSSGLPRDSVALCDPQLPSQTHTWAICLHTAGPISMGSPRGSGSFPAATATTPPRWTPCLLSADGQLVHQREQPRRRRRPVKGHESDRG
jgi:hypothetical protein